MATSRRAGALDAPIFGPPQGGPSGATDAPATLGILPGPRLEMNMTRSDGARGNARPRPKERTGK
jgi:hypothetical protein